MNKKRGEKQKEILPTNRGILPTNRGIKKYQSNITDQNPSHKSVLTLDKYIESTGFFNFCLQVFSIFVQNISV